LNTVKRGILLVQLFSWNCLVNLWTYKLIGESLTTHETCKFSQPILTVISNANSLNALRNM